MNTIQKILQWGIDLIKVIQTIETPVLSAFMVFFSYLGSGIVYLLILFFIIWCVDDKAGIKLSVLIIFSTWVNSFLKIMFKQPRPYDFDPSVGRAFESSYGFPSGHAQSVFIFFLSLAAWVKKNVMYIITILIILMMSFSRLYFGVHFPTDIFGGWIAGFIILSLYWLFAGRIIKVLEVASIRFRLILSAAVSFIMLLLHPGNLEMSGIFLGLGMGYTLMVRFFPFDVKKKKDGEKAGLFTLVLRYLLGLTCTGIVLLLGRKLIGIFESPILESSILESSGVSRMIPFVSYALTGAMVTAGVPWLFIQTGLSVRKDKNG